MFVYLSKKIAIPNNTRLNCISWNREQGYVAVGGDEGLLKVLKLEAAAQGGQARGGLAAPSNLSMNQTLDGHKASVQVVTWNEAQQKLTTSDRDGVIMVWMLYKGSWYEEMTNDRKKSTVKGMAWTRDGQKICIVYEDGAIIVGSVDGNRIWGKELKGTPLTGVQWSPDGRLLLFSVRSGELHLYDNQGAFVMRLHVQCVSLGPSRSLSIASCVWFSGSAPANRPVLAVLYETGRMQLMRSENDDLPIIVDTQMQAISCQWNHDGAILAVCGMKSSGSDKESNQAMFYSAYGVHLRTLKIPGREVTSLAWEGRSLRIAFGVDSFIYFANIRPDYMWCSFAKTVVFLNADGVTFTFWDTSSNQCFSKSVETPLSVAASVDHCVLAVEAPRLASRDANVAVENNFPDQAMFQLLVCNSMSTTVDSRYIDLWPHFVAMNSSHVAVASKEQFLLWPYRTPKGVSALPSTKARRERRFHVDDTPSGVAEVLNDLDRGGFEVPTATGGTTDPICCIAASDKVLLVGRESGTMQEYSIPHVALLHRHTVPGRAYKIAVNSNSTRAAVIDATGALTTLSLGGREAPGSQLERKDVWAMCWARDNPQLLAIMEKTRMYVLRGADPEEPISCSGYICNFQDLEITGVLLDDIVSGSATPNSADHILQLRVKSLRDTEELLNHVGIAEAKQFIEDNPHPRLWRLLAEACLKKLDLETAEAAFVRCTNYAGLQLIKRLRSIQNENLKRAEVASFFGDFDEAEKLYIDADRRDLAIQLRQTLCDWFRTVQLYRMGPGISDQQMEQAWVEIGHHFAHLRSWESAREYYEKAHHIEGLMEALYQLELYEDLEACVARVPEGSPLLARLGQMLSSVGMCDAAVGAFLRLGDVKSAVNCCVALRQWGAAVELAQKYRMPQIGALLAKHAAQLLQDGRLPEAVELQRKAGRFLDAARLLVRLAEDEVARKADRLLIKKLYVLAGLLTEDHVSVQCSLTGNSRATVMSHLSPEDALLIERIWQFAEGYHFLLLAQRQLKSGLMHSAVLTTLRLREYENVLDAEEIYGLLALASCADRSFGTASRAFIKLEALEALPEPRRVQYEELSVAIFSRHEPTDTQTDRASCFTCEALVADSCASCPHCGTRFPACVASGRALVNPTDAWLCAVCHHLASPGEIATRRSCPLCHGLIGATSSGARDSTDL
ncbi:WD repeat-containing protein 35 [Phlebotomus argentipes]|uniref:WD repeat-containing protein 35 n=1 Tax=Phlebotomus argentipes TaxID=94469 RepID=UPI002892F419|nr:WD repeat-containing protein 35 [Phlebotomus argentipes]